MSDVAASKRGGDEAEPSPGGRHVSRMPRRSRMTRYGVAPLVTGLALLAQALLVPLFEGSPNSTPFIVFFAAVMASAWFGGTVPC